MKESSDNLEEALPNEAIRQELTRSQKLAIARHAASIKLNDLQSASYNKISLSLKKLVTQQFLPTDIVNILEAIGRYVFLCGDVHEVAKLLDQKDGVNVSYRNLLQNALRRLCEPPTSLDSKTNLFLAVICFYFGLSHNSPEVESELKTAINKPAHNDFTDIKGITNVHSKIALNCVNEILISNPNQNATNSVFRSYALFLKLLCEFNISKPVNLEQYEKDLIAAAKLLNTAHGYFMLAIFFSLDSIQKYKEAATNFANSYQLGNKEALKYYNYNYALYQQDLINKKYPAEERLSNKSPFFYFSKALILGYEVAAVNIFLILDEGTILKETKSLDAMYELYQEILKSESTYKKYGLSAELVKKILIKECLDKLIYGVTAKLGRARYNDLCEKNLNNKYLKQHDLDKIIANCFMDDFDSNKLISALNNASSDCISSVANNEEYIDEFYKKVQLELYKFIWSKNTESTDLSKDDHEDITEKTMNSSLSGCSLSASSAEKINSWSELEVRTSNRADWVRKLNTDTQSFSTSEPSCLRLHISQEEKINATITSSSSSSAAPISAISSKFAKYLTDRLNGIDGEPPLKKARLNNLP